MVEKSRITVGILSDTHGRFPRTVYEALADCDHIIHAGDIGDPEIIRTLEALAPTTAVLGNNDFDEYGESVRKFATPRIGGIAFLVSHYPRDVDLKAGGQKAIAPGDPIPRVCVHGHTHVPRVETGKDIRPADLLICPGAVFRPRGGSMPSVAKLVIEDEKVVDHFFEEV